LFNILVFEELRKAGAMDQLYSIRSPFLEKYIGAMGKQALAEYHDFIGKHGQSSSDYRAAAESGKMPLIDRIELLRKARRQARAQKD
jgi:hypothetical protein